jgi:hypothetical protein
MSEMQPKGKHEEKDEKHHEKEEKGRGDPLNTAVWGLIIIWAGLAFLADSLGIFRSLSRGDSAFPLRFEAWALIFLGAGVILLLEAVVRLIVPIYRRAVTGTVIIAIVFIGIGLGNLTTWNVMWPLLLIGIGVVVLVRGFRWRT